MRSPFNNLFSDFSNFRLVYRDNFWKIRKSHRMVKTDGKNPWFPDISGEDFPEPILNPALARDEEGDFGPRRLRLRGPSGWRARATWHQRRHGVTVGNVGKAENGGGKGWKKSGWRGKHAWCLVDFFWRSMVKMDDGGLEKGGFEQRECGFELKKRGYKLNCENPASVTLYWKILVHCIWFIWLHGISLAPQIEEHLGKWVHCDDLTATSLEWWLEGAFSELLQFTQISNCYNIQCSDTLELEYVGVIRICDLNIVEYIDDIDWLDKQWSWD